MSKMRFLPLILCLALCSCSPSEEKVAKASSLSTSKPQVSWEKIEHPYNLTLHRSKVPGGWLVTVHRWNTNNFILQIDDPPHKWVVGKWEKISHPQDLNIYRLKVPTGWLLTMEAAADAAQAQFIFDAQVVKDRIQPNTQSWATKPPKAK